MSDDSGGLDFRPIRWKLEKFDGNAPTRIGNVVRMAVGYGPKMPVEIVTWEEGSEKVTDCNCGPDRKWFMFHAIQWCKEKINAFN